MSVDSFMESTEPPSWGSPIEIERRNRIRLTIAAYAYEFESTSIMSDGDYDKLSLQINPSLSTIENSIRDEEQIKRYKSLDRFFQKEFSPDTGQWIHKHPELDRVAWYYNKHYKGKYNGSN